LTPPSSILERGPFKNVAPSFFINSVTFSLGVLLRFQAGRLSYFACTLCQNPRILTEQTAIVFLRGSAKKIREIFEVYPDLADLQSRACIG